MPEVWPRRQKVSQQQAPIGSALMVGIERTDIVMVHIVMVHSNQRVGFVPCNPYAIEVDKGSRNCYNCGGFGHLTRNCRNKGIGGRIGEGRRLEYRQRNNRQRTLENKQDNLNGK